MEHETQQGSVVGSETQGREQTAPEHDGGGAAATAQVHAMIAAGRVQPEAVAQVMRAHDGQRDAIVAMLQRALGNSYVQRVVAALAEPPKAGGETAKSWQMPGMVRVTAPEGLHVRRTPNSATAENIVGGLHVNAEIEALAHEGSWLRVHHGGNPAFIHGDFVEPAPVAAAPSATSTPETPVAHQAAQTASVAKQAATSQPTAGAVTNTPATSPSTTNAPSAPAPSGGGAVAAKSPDTTDERAASIHASPAVEPTTARAGEFTTLSGNSIAATTKEEAAVMEKLRHEPRRFNPAWLLAAQHNLGVVDATGAFNTETLRAMRSRASNGKLDAKGIMDAGFLSSVAPGEPFVAGAELGYLPTRDKGDPAATSPKDRKAKLAGYASFADYQIAWDKNIKFLGKTLGNGRAHPYLTARLKVAEAFLRGRHPEAKTDLELRNAVGWSGEGNASYDDDPASKATHQHAMGLALDIDPGQNVYLFDHHVNGISADASNWWVKMFADMYEVGSRAYGTDALNSNKLWEMTRELSTEELMPRIRADAASFGKLLDLSVRAEKSGSSDEARQLLTKLGYTGTDLETRLTELVGLDKNFHMQQGRKDAKGVTNIREELVIALRDVAGFAWGGAELHPNENGDFMHFDCRWTDFGGVIYDNGKP